MTISKLKKRSDKARRLRFKFEFRSNACAIIKQTQRKDNTILRGSKTGEHIRDSPKYDQGIETLHVNVSDQFKAKSDSRSDFIR